MRGALQLIAALLAVATGSGCLQGACEAPDSGVNDPAAGSGRCWSEPLTLSPTGLNVQSEKMALGADGEVYVAWTQSDLGGYAVELERYTPGAGWSAPEEVSPGGRKEKVALSANGVGEVAVGWLETTAANQELWSFKVMLFKPLTGWIALGRANPIRGGFTFADVSLDDRGVVVASWVEGNLMTTQPRRVWTRRFENGAWGEPEHLGAEDQSGGIWGTASALNRAGDRIISWAEVINPGTVPEVFAAISRGSEGWKKSRLSPQGSTETSCAIAPNGDAVVGWVEFAGQVSASRYTGSWSVPSRVSGVGSGDGVSAAIDANGNSAVVWRMSYGVEGAFHVDTTIGLARYGCGQWETEAALDATGSFAPRLPVVAMNAAGLGMATWHSDRVPDVIRGARLGVASGVSASDDLYDGNLYNDKYIAVDVASQVAVTPGGVRWTMLAGRGPSKSEREVRVTHCP